MCPHCERGRAGVSVCPCAHDLYALLRRGSPVRTSGGDAVSDMWLHAWEGEVSCSPLACFLPARRWRRRDRPWTLPSPVSDPRRRPLLPRP